MQHMTLKASTLTDTDLGEFTALVSTPDLDRQGDIVRHGAFAEPIRRWRASRKMVPLHWDHRSENPEDIVGQVDPAQMKETREIRSVDVFEISATPSPANDQTKVLSWKSRRPPPPPADATSRAFNDDDRPMRKAPRRATWSCPPELIGTAWDPMMATGETKGFTKAEIESERKALRRTRPIKIARFEV